MIFTDERFRLGATRLKTRAAIALSARYSNGFGESVEMMLSRAPASSALARKFLFCG
jgi:hypothetical protein